MSTALTGRELLAFVKENPELAPAALATATGYVRVARRGERAGQEVPNIGAFKDALLEAKGLSLKSEAKGRASSSETTVHAAGTILIGSIYAEQAGVGPGDRYSITINENSQIVLDLIHREEGSPLPFKVYARSPRKPEADATSEISQEPVAA